MTIRSEWRRRIHSGHESNDRFRRLLIRLSLVAALVAAVACGGDPATDSSGAVSPARAAAETYRESVNTKDLALLRTIFADDVVLSVPTMAMDLANPDGVFRGIEEAMAFFEKTSFEAKAILTYTHVYEDDNSCVVELKGRLPAGNDVEALDIFTVNDEGLVDRMTVYARIAT